MASGNTNLYILQRHHSKPQLRNTFLLTSRILVPLFLSAARGSRISVNQSSQRAREPRCAIGIIQASTTFAACSRNPEIYLSSTIIRYLPVPALLTLPKMSHCTLADRTCISITFPKPKPANLGSHKPLIVGQDLTQTRGRYGRCDQLHGEVSS